MEPLYGFSKMCGYRERMRRTQDSAVIQSIGRSHVFALGRKFGFKAVSLMLTNRYGPATI
jgi:hypothetical protein